MNQNELLALLKPMADDIDAAMRADLGAVTSPELSEVLTHALFNGGKRVRPLLAVIAARLCGRPDSGIFRLAMAFEYLHAASLLHDDVIDRAEQRRGRPAANTLWGNVAAILAGDYLHTRAMTLAGALGGEAGLRVIGNATAAMVEAEFLQMQTVRTRDLDESNYFAVLHGKTAALIAAPCEVGALYAGGDDDERAALRRYGTDLGIAFQIIDDLLDYQGDPSRTGKAVGNDFQEGKMTLPLLHAISRANPGDRRALMDLLAGEPEKRAAAFDTARNLIDTYNGFSHARQRAEALIEAATAALQPFAACQEKEMLLALADYVLKRQK